MTYRPSSRFPKRPSKAMLKLHAAAQSPDGEIVIPKAQAKSAAPMQRPEEALQRSVIHAFQYILPEEVIFWHTPNQRANAFMRQLLKSLGVRPGVYDIALCWPHRNFAVIELKAGKNDRDGAQIEFGAAIEKCGFPIATCWTIEDVVAALRRFGVPMTGHSLAALGELF